MHRQQPGFHQRLAQQPGVFVGAGWIAAISGPRISSRARIVIEKGIRVKDTISVMMKVEMIIQNGINITNGIKMMKKEKRKRKRKI